MCKGKGAPGNSTTSRGKRGRSKLKPPPKSHAGEGSNPDCTPPLDLLSGGDYKLDMEPAGHVVVITGASMGIGKARARVFVDHGASVFLLSRDAGRAEAARAEILVRSVLSPWLATCVTARKSIAFSA